MHFLQTKSIVRNLNTDFILNDWLFGSVKLTKNVNPDKYKYSGYGIGFDSRTKVFTYRWKHGKKCHYF